MSKRLISLLLVGILVLSLAAGCGPKDVEEPAGGNESAGGEQQSGGDKVDTATKSNDQIVVALEADITSLDPQGHNDVISEKVSFLVFNRLFRLNENFEAVPDLAEDWSQPSEKEWLLKIKEGVKFHNGEEMTAEDVKFSMERSIESPKVQHVLEQLEKVEVVDKYTVKVTTKDVFAPFINTLVHAGISVIPKDYVESNGDWANEPIGSGQYKFVEWVSGDKVVLEKNEDYYDKDEMGIADKIVFRVIPEGTSRTIALETGEVDVVVSLEAMDAPKVRDNSDLALYEKPSTNFSYLGMNTQKAPFNDKTFRQAMNYAIDKEAILAIALDGEGVIATSMTSDALLGHVASDYTYDPDKAMELLKASGKEGISIEIWASGDVRKRVAEIAQANLLDIGISSEIKMYEWGAFIDATNSGEQPMFTLGWDSNPDVDATLTPQFTTGSIGAQNRAQYSSERVDKLIAEGRAELDNVKRKEIYEEIYRTLNDDAPWVPLYIENKIVGARNGLKEVKLNSQGLIDLHKLHY